jgi:hypothetical protein
MQTLTFVSAPSPPLPRKRGREQAEFAAAAVLTSPKDHASSTTAFRSTPISGTSTSTTSPGLSHFGGL